MKTTLDENGTLIIAAESAVEQFALSQWHVLWEQKNVTLLITTVKPSHDGAGMDKHYTPVESGT